MYGSEAQARLLKELVKAEGEGWVQQNELARRMNIDKKTVQSLFKKFIQLGQDAFEEKKPYGNVKIYRLKKDSRVAQSVKIFFDKE